MKHIEQCLALNGSTFTEKLQCFSSAKQKQLLYLHIVIIKWAKVLRVPSEPSWHPTPALLPGKSHGRRSLVGCSPWGRHESDTTERLHLHFSLSHIGGGNGNPLQSSCLENPRDGRACWAAVYGVAHSWTRLKQHRSSSSELWKSLKNLCAHHFL